MKPEELRRSIPFHVKLGVIFASVLAFAGLSWYVYQRMTFLHYPVSSDDSLPEVDQQLGIYTTKDSLLYGDYTIVRTEAKESPAPSFRVKVFKNGKIVYRHPTDVTRKEFNEVALVPLLGDSTQQLIIQQYSGGTHCCWSSTVLELADSLRVMYRSGDYPELGNELEFGDIDGDSVMELSQSITSFDNFDRLSYADSPISVAYFELSKQQRRYVPANRHFSSLVMKDAVENEVLVKAIADTTNFETWNDQDGEYLSLALEVFVNCAYAGQVEKGWAFFDRWYKLRDRDRLRRKIQAVLNSSKLYLEIQK